jgi:hypothetical protein
MGVSFIAASLVGNLDLADRPSLERALLDPPVQCKVVVRLPRHPQRQARASLELADLPAPGRAALRAVFLHVHSTIHTVMLLLLLHTGPALLPKLNPKP